MGSIWGFTMTWLFIPMSFGFVACFVSIKQRYQPVEKRRRKFVSGGGFVVYWRWLWPWPTPFDFWNTGWNKVSFKYLFDVSNNYFLFAFFTFQKPKYLKMTINIGNLEISYNASSSTEMLHYVPKVYFQFNDLKK